MEPFTSVTGATAPLDRANVDTDQIMPKEFLKRIERTGFGEFIFHNWRQEEDDFVLERPEFRDAPILVAGPNFGSGSSREHAPQGLRRWGIRAIVGESFAEIFFGNSLMIGLACVTAAPSDIEALMALVDREPGTPIVVDIAAGVCHAGTLRFPVSAPPAVRDALMSGAWDTTGLLMDRYDEVNAAAARLPYLSGSSSPRSN